MVFRYKILCVGTRLRGISSVFIRRSTSCRVMSYIVRMPKLGVEMEVGEVVEWHVSVGDAVEEGDVLAEIESEKSVGGRRTRGRRAPHGLPRRER